MIIFEQDLSRIENIFTINATYRIADENLTKSLAILTNWRQDNRIGETKKSGVN